jgi:predicted DNA binding CopG/RHH family protein
LEDSNSGEPEKPFEKHPSKQSPDEASSTDQDALKHVLRAHARLRERRKHERLTVPTTVRFSPADVDVIEARAASVGLSFSTYVRTATLAAGEEPLLGALFADRFQDTLSRIRNRLIAKTKAAVRSELKNSFEPEGSTESDAGETSKEQAMPPHRPSAPDLSRAILQVVVPTVEEEMERLEKTLEEVRRQYPVHTASGENVAESSEAGDSGDDTE